MTKLTMGTIAPPQGWHYSLADSSILPTVTQGRPLSVLLRFQFFPIYCSLALWMCFAPACSANALQEQAKQLLSHPYSSADRQIAALQDYLEQSSDKHGAASLVLRSHARLHLAALQFRKGQFEKSKNNLMQIPQNSPVAVESALVLAHVYFATGKKNEGIKWYLRVSKRYAYHPKAIQGLLEAAKLMSSTASGSALQLCNTATDNALAAIKQLGKLQKLIKDKGLDALIIHQNGIDNSIQMQLTETVLLSPEAHLFRDGSNLDLFSKKYKQVLSQLYSLKKAQTNLDIQKKHISSMLLQLQNVTKKETALISVLKKRINKKDNNQSTRIRRQISKLINANKRHAANIELLQHSHSALPLIRKKLHSKAVTLLQSTSQRTAFYKHAFSAHIHQAIHQLDIKWHNLAASGQLLKADLLSNAILAAPRPPHVSR